MCHIQIYFLWEREYHFIIKNSVWRFLTDYDVTSFFYCQIYREKSIILFSTTHSLRRKYAREPFIIHTKIMWDSHVYPLPSSFSLSLTSLSLSLLFLLVCTPRQLAEGRSDGSEQEGGRCLETERRQRGIEAELPLVVLKAEPQHVLPLRRWREARSGLQRRLPLTKWSDNDELQRGALSPSYLTPDAFHQAIIDKGDLLIPLVYVWNNTTADGVKLRWF